MNRIVLIGNLTRDPELKYTPTGVPVATFAVAVNRPTKNAQGEREVDFINVVCWRQRAEFVSQYLAKGRKIAVEGRLQIRNYVAQDGMKRYVTEVVADNVEPVEPRGDSSGAPPAQSVDSGGAPAPEVDDFVDPFSEE